MTKNVLKKMASITMVAVLMLSMTACGKKKEEESQQKTDTREMVYKGTELALEGVEGDVGSFFVQNEKLYVLTYEWNEKEDKSAEEGETEADLSGDKEQSTESPEEDTENTEREETSEEDDQGAQEEPEEGTLDEEEASEETVVERMYVANMDGSDVKELPLPKLQENEYINTPFMDSNENIMYLMSSYDQKSEIMSWYIVKVDEQGKELIREDVTSTLKLTEDMYISKVVPDDIGRIAVISDQVVYVLDEDFKLLCEVKSDGYIDGGARTKDGTIICGNSNEDGARVQVLDIEQKKWGESYPLDMQYFSSSDSLINGLDSDFYYKDDSGIYGYDMKTKKSTKLMDYLASDLESDKTYSIVPFGKDKFLGSIYENEKTKLIVYNKVDPSSIADKQTITFGAMYLDDSIKTAGHS